MKKMMLVAAACAMVAAPSVLRADTVTSVNVVGYYTVTIDRGSDALLSAPLIPDGDSTIPSLFGEQLPSGSKVYFWNRSLSPAGYDTVSYEPGGRGGTGDPVWGGATGSVVTAGDGFWVRIPNTASNAQYEITFMGEVPGPGNTFGTNTLVNLDGFQIVAYAFPTDVSFLDTQLALNPDVIQVYVWDGRSSAEGGQKYISFSRDTPRGGDPYSGAWVGDSPVIPAGQSFWIRTKASVDWTEEAPYLNNL